VKRSRLAATRASTSIPTVSDTKPPRYLRRRCCRSLCYATSDDASPFSRLRNILSWNTPAIQPRAKFEGEVLPIRYGLLERSFLVDSNLTFTLPWTCSYNTFPGYHASPDRPYLGIRRRSFWRTRIFDIWQNIPSWNLSDLPKTAILLFNVG